MTGYIDTHAHYSDEAFDGDRQTLIGSLFESGVIFIIDPAIDLKSSYRVTELASLNSNYYCAVGIHPHNASEAHDSDYDDIAALIEKDAAEGSKKIAAVGETGLDYHYDFSPRDVQITNFRKNIRMALKYGLPLIVHDREAHQDTFEVLLDEGAFKGKVLYHCYSGSAEYAELLLKYGCYFSFGGAVTFKNAKKFDSVLKTIPSGFILPETDSPYMAPEPVRGTRNDSLNLRYIYPALAMRLGMSEEEFANKMADNTSRFFGIRINSI
ncbi:MAG: TatD family hydrolase [Clostridia bacterium]|nr:TatD family hydrolase [Clostridia bacterium]